MVVLVVAVRAVHVTVVMMMDLMAVISPMIAIGAMHMRHRHCFFVVHGLQVLPWMD